MRLDHRLAALPAVINITIMRHDSLRQIADPMMFKPLQQGKLIRIVQPAYKLGPEIAIELGRMLAPLGLSLGGQS